MRDDTPAKRAYAIRLALGDGWKVPMPMAAFAALLSQQPGAGRYDSSIVSRIESGARRLTINDAPIFATVDPLRRGPEWIAWGEPKTPPMQGGARDPLEDVTFQPVSQTEEQDQAEVAERTGGKSAKRRNR